MEQRRIGLYVFGSAKGGVGKSTLAVACARLIVGHGRACVLIDADLTGTSLADGLLLCAPRVELQEDGRTMNLDDEPSGAFYDPAQTLAQRDRRKMTHWQEHPPYIPFFNDALVYRNEQQVQDCKMGALLWRHANKEDRVHYLPSSSLPRDVGHAVTWLNRDDLYNWRQRLAWILEALVVQLPWLTDIVVDLPPGLFGFSREVLGLLAHLSQGVPLPEGFPDLGALVRWQLEPFLVMTPDQNDLLTAMESYAALVGEISELTPLVNRLNEDIKFSRQRVRRRFPEFPGFGLEDRMVSIDNLNRTLGRIFLDGGLAMGPEVEALAQRLHTEGR